MPAIEPGDTFTVGYGNGHSIEVVALSMRQKRLVTADMKRVHQLKTEPESIDELYAIAEKMLRACIANFDEGLLDKIDETMALDIVGKTLGCAALSDDERKNSELPR